MKAAAKWTYGRNARRLGPRPNGTVHSSLYQQRVSDGVLWLKHAPLGGEGLLDLRG